MTTQYDKYFAQYERLINRLYAILNLRMTLSTDDTLCNDFAYCFAHWQKHLGKDLFVSVNTCDNTIFTNRESNYKFRALHDYIHFLFDKKFTLEDEIQVAILTNDYLLDYARNDLDKKTIAIMQAITYCEILQQGLHLEIHGLFVGNQKEFTINYLKQLGI